MQQQLLDAFAEGLAARSAAGGKPTGARISPTLWSALTAAGKIRMVPARIRFSGTADLDQLPALPIDYELPTYEGTILQVDAGLDQHTDFEFSPR